MKEGLFGQLLGGGWLLLELADLRMGDSASEQNQKIKLGISGSTTGLKEQEAEPSGDGGWRSERNVRRRELSKSQRTFQVEQRFEVTTGKNIYMSEIRTA